MRRTTYTGRTPARCAPLLVAAAILAYAGAAGAQGSPLPASRTLKADVTLRTTYDDNVYILDTQASAGIAAPSGLLVAIPNRASMITTVTPTVSLSRRAGAATTASVSYAADLVRYHSASSENHVTHRGSINLTGKVKKANYDVLNSLVWIDGNNQGLTVRRPGDTRAIGGIPLRDRRAAAIYRGGLKLTIPAGKWFVRPVASAYVHDFGTEQRANLAANKNRFVYDNFVSRWDVNGGVDIGYEAFDKTRLAVGYRFGHQFQGTVLKEGSANATIVAASPYVNDYQRFLVGVEGTPVSWLKLAILGGPEVRDWQRATPNGFDRGEMLWYLDGLVTVQPTKDQTITLRATRFEQPAFTSQSVYEDIKSDLTWRGKLAPKLTAGAGFTLYVGAWQAPVLRDDWIYTKSLVVSYALSPHLAADVSWSHDRAVNKVTPVIGTATEFADGRGFTRDQLSFALKYIF